MDDAPALFPLITDTAHGGAGAMEQDQFDVDSPWHFHDVHQLQYTFDGAMEVEDPHQRALLPRQLAAWIPAGVIHRTSLHRVRSVSVMFAPSHIADPGDRIRIIQVAPLLREMIFEAARWPIDRALDGKGKLFFDAFAMLLEEWIGHEAPLFLPTSADPRLEAAMKYTRAHLRSASITGASDAAHMSVRTLRRRFQAIGISWEQYRRRARLLAAIALLDESALPIGEIAARIGYENQGAFAKAFFDLLAMTPTGFRKRSKSRSDAHAM